MAILAILFLLSSFFGAYAGNLMQTDTYAKWFYTIEAYRSQYHTNARLAEWIYMEFFYRIMGEPQHFRCFHVTVGIVVDCIIIFTLWKVICYGCNLQRQAEKILALLLAIMTRVNVFYSDIFQYGVDAAPMFIGDLFAIISAIMVTESIVKRKRIAYVAGVLLLMVSLMFRQTCLFWFIFTSLLIVFFEGDFTGIQSFLKKIAALVITVLLSVIPMLLLINFWAPKGSRGSFANVNLMGSWESFCNTFLQLLKDCDGVQPRGFYTVLLGLAFLANIGTVFLLIKRNGRRCGLILLIQEAIVTAGVIAGIFFPVAFEVFLPHRTTCGFATLLPLWMIFILRYRDVWNDVRSKELYAAAVCVLLLNIAVNYHYTHVIYNGLKETNRIDQANARYYYSLITDYEKRTGKEIHKLAWHFDKYFTWNIPGIIGTKNLNNRAYCAPWSQREIFPFVVGRRFEIVPFNEDLYEKYYYGKDWSELDEEQVMFLDDTVYIVLY